MAFSAHKDPEMVKERFDDKEVAERKLLKVVKMMKRANFVVLFTGAGISTSAGIPDFRGPDGVWTLKAQGRKREKPRLHPLHSYPTPCHMAIVELVKRGVVKYIISQNCDGLHRRSGIPESKISELHGNVNIEICDVKSCEKKYYRDFDAVRIHSHTTNHFTGRYCECGGKLQESTIDFSQSLPAIPLDRAFKKAYRGDLMIVLGSSCTVRPACHTLDDAKKNKGELVIVNLQKTPYHDRADLNVFMKTDDFMIGLMKHMDIKIPVWKIERRIRFDYVVNQKERKWNFYVTGLRHDTEQEGKEIEFSCIRRCRYDLGGDCFYESNKENFECEFHFEELKKVESLKLTIFWFGWHEEKPFTIHLPLIPNEDYEFCMDISYELLDPETNLRRKDCEWKIVDISSEKYRELIGGLKQKNNEE